MEKIIDVELFMADYSAVLEKKDAIVEKAVYESNKLDVNEDIRNQVKDLLIERNTVDINNELAFFEKYLKDAPEHEDVAEDVAEPDSENL